MLWWLGQVWLGRVWIQSPTWRWIEWPEGWHPFPIGYPRRRG